MRPILTPEEMAAADKATIEAGTPVEVLMERAGRAVARAAIDVAGGRYGKRAVVICGKGNNGGDGFVVARVLRDEGFGVRCVFVGDTDAIEGASRHHLEALRRRGGALTSFDARKFAGADVIVDALFGTGFRGTAEGPAADAIETMNSSGAPIVAVDIPSGVNGVTGAVDGPAVEAIVTVAMAAEKLGTAIGRGAALAGAVAVADIGIAVSDARIGMAQEEDVRSVLPERSIDAHKRSNGSVALLVGSEGMSGAAILTARGAVRMGAGYATIGLTQAIDPIVSEALPEVLTKIVTTSDVLGPDALENFKEVLERADALAIGPGLGQRDAQLGLVERVLREVQLAVVIDADGLNVLAGHTELLTDRSAATVITPHPAELARLLETETDAIQKDRVGAARAAAERFGAVVVLKGFRSIIARPDRTVVVNPTGGPSLATAGTGDVLTGAIAALVAGGLDPFEAAWAGTYVHGLAGDLAGDTGVVAWDVAEALPDAMGLVQDI